MHHNFSVAKCSPITITVKREKRRNSISIPNWAYVIHVPTERPFDQVNFRLLRRTNIPSTQILSVMIWLPALETPFLRISLQKVQMEFPVDFNDVKFEFEPFTSSLSLSSFMCGLVVQLDVETCMWQSGRDVFGKILKSFQWTACAMSANWKRWMVNLLKSNAKKWG